MVVGEKVAKSVVLIMLSLFVLSLASASIAISPVTNVNTVGYPGEILTYKVTMYNVGNETNETISLFGATFEDNFGNSLVQMTIQPSSSKEVIIKYQIPGGFNPGSVSPQIAVFDSNGVQFTSIQLQGKVLAIPPKYSTTQITEALVLQNGLVGQIDPRDSFDIKLITYNPSVSTVVSITVTSGFELVYSQTIQIKNGTGSAEINGLQIPEDTIPGDYPFTVTVRMPDGTTPTKVSAISVKGYSSCELKEESSIGLFGRNYKATVSNPGTEVMTCNVQSSYSNIESGLLTDPTQGATISAGKITWTLNVGAGESKVVGYSVNYIPLVAIPFFVILLGFSFWYFTRKMEITKELIDFKLYPGTSDLKIQVRVKNLSGAPYKDVSVTEMLPAFVKEIKEFGTAKGSVEKHGKHNVIVWKLIELMPHEERVFSYKVRTSVEIIGKMIFPTTIVSFLDSNGQKHREESGPLIVEVQETKYKG